MPYLVGPPSHKNLGEALEGLLAHHLAAERKRQTDVVVASQIPIWQSKRASRASPKLERLQQHRREERLARYEQVIALRKLGLSQAAIALQIGIGASTVQSWLAAGTFPERKPREQASQLDRYLPYVIGRWEDGCHNIARHFRELTEQGYQGSYESVRDHLVRPLPTGRKKQAPLSSKMPALATHGKRRSCSFVALKNYASRNRRCWLSFVRSTSGSIGLMISFSSLL